MLWDLRDKTTRMKHYFHDRKGSILKSAVEGLILYEISSVDLIYRLSNNEIQLRLLDSLTRVIQTTKFLAA